VLLAAWLALAPVATAAVTFDRPPEKDEAGALDPEPSTTSEREQKEWRQKVQRRAIWAGVDATVRGAAPDVDACLRAAGVAAPVEATLELVVDVQGVARAKAGGKADPAVAACVIAPFDTVILPVLLVRTVDLDYTVKWDGVAPAEAPAPAPPPEGSPATATLAFAPLADNVPGLGALVWGAKADSFEAIYASNSREKTTFYTRVADYGTRWLGVPVQALVYGFGADGLYVVTLGITGTTAQWQLRESLVARYGPSRWDTRFNAYYWRGEDCLVQLAPTPGSQNAVVTLLDIARAKDSGLADRLPGDRDEPGAVESNRRMPKIYKDDK